MILGVYADLHANLPALEAMQSAAGAVDLWIALGDSVGLYPYVNEVLDWQQRNNVLYVKGDHEAALVSGEVLHESFTGNESIRKQSEVIDRDALHYVSSIEDAIDIETDDLRIRVTHFLTSASAHPESKYLLNIRDLGKLYENYDFVFFGHTHLPAVLYGRNTVFINPGSAGFPVDVLRQCSMIVFDTVTRHFELVRFDYDRTRLIDTIKKRNYNQKLVTYIQNGHRWG